MTRERKRPPVLTIAALVIAAVIAALVFFNPKIEVVKRIEHRITTVILPPPPPPPPPPEKPPEPEKKIDQLKPDTPKEIPKPDEQPPQDEALQAREGPGANDFGLQKGTGNGMKIGGGDHASGFGIYARVLQKEIQDALARNERTRKAKFRMTLNLWLTASGAVERSEVIGSDGDRRFDSIIPQVLSGLTISQQPPQDLPQPVRLRIGAQSTM